VTEPLDLFGLEVADMGGTEAEQTIEPLAMLRCIPEFSKNERRHALTLLTPSFGQRNAVAVNCFGKSLVFR